MKSNKAKANEFLAQNRQMLVTEIERRLLVQEIKDWDIWVKIHIQTTGNILQTLVHPAFQLIASPEEPTPTIKRIINVTITVHYNVILNLKSLLFQGNLIQFCQPNEAKDLYFVSYYHYAFVDRFIEKLKEQVKTKTDSVEYFKLYVPPSNADDGIIYNNELLGVKEALEKYRTNSYVVKQIDYMYNEYVTKVLVLDKLGIDKATILTQYINI